MRRQKPKRLPLLLVSIVAAGMLLVVAVFGWPLLLGTEPPTPTFTTESEEPLSSIANTNEVVISGRSIDRAESSKATPIIHNAWSRQAYSSRFSSKLHATCKVCKYNQIYMESRTIDIAEMQSESKHLPYFCDATFVERGERQQVEDKANNFARFSFSKQMRRDPSSPPILNAVQQPQTVPLILCAIGQRFSGPGGQSYVLEAIRQWRLFHPPAVSTIYLVMDASIAENNVAVRDLIASEKEGNTIRVYDPKSILTSDWRSYFKVFYIQGYMHPGGSRKTGNQHFNQYVNERFFAIESIMRRENLQHVIHMENDIMVYDSLLPVVHAASRCGHEMATTVIHSKGVIPSVLYIKNADAIKHFNTYLNEFLSCGLDFGKAIQRGYANDMTYLMNYYQLYGSKHLGLLPSWLHEEGEVCVADELAIALKVDSFPLFDVASFGQWYSFAVAHNDTKPPEHIRNSMRGRFLDATPPPLMTWETYKSKTSSSDGNDESRLVPRWKGRRLLSLHIHAKNLERFRSIGDTHYARSSFEG